MSGFLEKNLPLLPESLRGKIQGTSSAPGGEVIKSSSGNPTLEVGGVYLHSRYDPEGEGTRWAEGYLPALQGKRGVVVFGFGLGYHLEALLEKFSGRVVVYEGNLSVLRRALEVRDLTGFLERVEILTEPVLYEPFFSFPVITHVPSVNVCPEFYARIGKLLENARIAAGGLRVLVVSPIYGGSYPIAKYVKTAFEERGHQVYFLDFSPLKEMFLSIEVIVEKRDVQNYLMAQLGVFGSEVIAAKTEEWKPDLIFVLSQALFSSELGEKFKKAGIPTACWFVENYRHMTYWKAVACRYDYFFTIQKEPFLSLLEKEGQKNAAYLPLACLPSVHRPVELTPEEREEYGADLSFVGAGYRNRKESFLQLIDFDLKIWGVEWDRGSPLWAFVQRDGAWVDTEEAVKIYSATKVNLNLHGSSGARGVDPLGDFVNPRTFELAACRAFQLVDERKLLPELFLPGEEVVTFRTPEEMKEKARYYLSHPEEREEIARRGYERALREHTYHHRVDAAIRFILERGFQPPAWKGRGKEKEVLEREAREYPELLPYIRSVVKGKGITIDDLAEEIHSGSGALSTPEKLILLLNEIYLQLEGRLS